MLQPSRALRTDGNDDLGCDIFSRLIHGMAPATIYVSFLAVAIAILIGVPIGRSPAILADGSTTSFLRDTLAFPADRLWQSP